MTAIKHKQPETSNKPLDQMAQTLHAEMEAVNTLIIARMQSHIPTIAELAEYLIASGGKRIRPLLTLASAYACGSVQKSVGLAAAVEFIHSATLLHDDVVDESAQRRGKAAANTVFGNKTTILVGDFLFARAFELMVESDDIRILDILARASRIIAEGEVLQMSLIGNIDITLQQYEAIIDAKTAALFSAATHAGALSAGADDKTALALRTYGHHLGMAFQMVDDLIDYAGVATRMGKDSGDDFREGKLTLPVILAVAKADASEKDFWGRTMQDHNQKDGDLEQARALIARHGSLAEGRILAQKHVTAARQALSALPQSEMKAVLDELLDFVVARDH